MISCPQDAINRIWRLFAQQGIGDDLQIIETLAYHLLRRSDLANQAGRSDYPQPAQLSGVRANSLEEHLAEALTNLSPADLLNHCLLFQPDTMQAGGRYPTPRHITRLMADLVRIFVADERAAIADFACGSGGLLVEFGQRNLTGVEISPTWARLARANLLLHGQSAGGIFTGNSLEIAQQEFSEQRGFLHSPGREARSFDAIVMNPPFGSPLEAALVGQRLGQNAGTRSETVLTLLALNYLGADGVLAVLQPGGAFFSTSSGEAQLRDHLLTKHALEAIIQLPKDAFQPYSQLQTYLLLARKTGQSSIATDAPVWFYQVTHDGYSSGRNRQPQPEQSQLPQLLAAAAAGQSANTWIIQDDQAAVQLEIRPLTTGGYRIVQPGSGKLSVHALTTAQSPVLWLTRQTEESHHALLYDSTCWRQQPIPTLRSAAALTPLAFRLADESGQTVKLTAQGDGWQLHLKSAQTITVGETMTPEEGYLALLIAATGELLSPLLSVSSLHNDYKPKSLSILPLENDDHTPTGSLLLWDCAVVKPRFFASTTADQGCFWLASDLGKQEKDQAAALIRWENGVIHRAVAGSLQRTFAGEAWQRGVVVDAQDVRFGVGVAPSSIAERDFDLSFDRYYLPDEHEPTVQRSAAEILATLRQKQQALAGRLDYLLGIVEMRPPKALPPPVVDVAPLGPLSHTQQLVWQRILAMIDAVGEATTAKPFRAEALADDPDDAEVQNALTLFERMGLIVPVLIDGAPYYRRLTERDMVAT